MREDAADALDVGVAFLLSRQAPDGLWHDFLTPAGEASTWPTAYIGTALRVAAAHRGSLEHAAAALVQRQRPDGGWGYNESTPSDADSTSWAVIFLAKRTSRETPPDVLLHAGAFLNRHQRRGGGVATYAEAGSIRRYTGLPRWVPFWGWCRPHVDVSAAAGQAHYALSPQAPEAVAAWRYVRSRQRQDGSWSSYWWVSPYYATSQAVTLAALNLHDRAPIDRAIGWVLREQRADGGWGATDASAPSALATALALSVLAAAEVVDQQSFRRGIDALLRLQHDDGGWPSRPELRIPPPAVRGPARGVGWRPIRVEGGMVVSDQHRTFTSATCVAALAAVRRLHSADVDRLPPAAS